MQQYLYMITLEMERKKERKTLKIHVIIYIGVICFSINASPLATCPSVLLQPTSKIQLSTSLKLSHITFLDRILIYIYIFIKKERERANKREMNRQRDMYEGTEVIMKVFSDTVYNLTQSLCHMPLFQDCTDE